MKKEHRKPHPGNIVITIVAIVMIVSGIGYSIYYWQYTNCYEETNDAQVESYINPVSARAGGYIERVCFDDHQLVKQGDTLVILDSREYFAQLQSAEAALEDAYGQEEVLVASIHSAELGTRVNEDQIKAAEAKYRQQQQDIVRYRNLVREEAATGSDLEQVQARHDVAESDYSAAKNTLSTNLARIQELNTRFSLLKADLKKKQAALDLARLSLSYTVIKAPYSGRLGRKTILEGQQIQPGQPLVSIINEGEKWVTANFKETQVEGMYIGQPVDIRVDAIQKKIFKGRIVAIAGSTGAKFSLLPPDNSTGNFVKIVQRIPVKIRFTDSSSTAVLPGMNVTVAVKKNEHE